MQRYVYQIVLEPAQEGGYCVYVPDLDGCATYGDDFFDAIKMASEALELYVASLLDEGIEVPQPTNRPCPEGCESVFVSFETDETVGTKVMSAAEAARRLGVSRGRVSRLLRAGILEGRNDWGNIFVTEESVERRLASNPKPGRPRKKAVPAASTATEASAASPAKAIA